MSSNLVLNPNQSVTLEAPVREIAVAQGSVVVTNGHDSTVVKEDNTHTVGDVAPTSVLSPEGARLTVTYADEYDEGPTRQELESELWQAEKALSLIPEDKEADGVREFAEARVRTAKDNLHRFYPKATRGDSGGSTGSYESRTLKELQALAKKRDIPGYSNLNKSELIDALRS